MEDIVEVLGEMLHEMTPTQRTIAVAIIQDPMQAAFSSAKALSEKLDVSPASVVRFSQLITDGGGYPQLQARIQAHIQSIANPVKRLELNIITGSKHEELLAQVYDTQLANLTKTFNPSLVSSINSACALISLAGHIYTVGSRGAFATAYYLGHHLNRVFNNADIISEDARLADFLMRLTDKDVVIFVAYPRYSGRLIAAVKKAKSVGAKVITITGGPQSPFIDHSDIVLYALYHSNDFHNSQLPAMLVSEMLVSLAISNNRKRSVDNLSIIEPIFDDLQQFSDK